jgi:hypothetical protein
LFALSEPGVWLDPSDTANLSWRRNLLTFTEQFDNAAWGKTAAGVAIAPTVTANAGIAPDGTTTADRIQFDCTNTGSSANRSSVTQNFTATTGVSYTSSIYIRAFDAGNVGRTVRITSDFIGTTVYTLTADWQRVVIGGTSSGTGSNLVIETRGTFTQQTADILLWGAQLEVGSTVSTYQAITDLNTEVRANFPNATLYQDTAGTTPVTTPGQSVALALDKSRGLVPGADQKANGATVVVGTATAATYNTTTGTGTCTRVDAANQSYVAFTGLSASTYLINITNTGSVVMYIRAGIGIGAVSYSISPGGNVVARLFATSGAFSVTSEVGTSAFTVNSVRELPGNHATQATAGSRPLYALLPANGVRNLANGSASVGDATYWPAAPVNNGITATKIGSGFDVDGLPYVDVRYQGTATNTFHSDVYLGTATPLFASSGQQWVCSATFSRIGGSPTNVNGIRTVVVEYTAPSTYVTQANSAFVTATTETTVSVSHTVTTGNRVNAVAQLVFTNGATIDVTYRIKALQFELGSTRTAYQFNYSNVNIAQPPFAQVGALLFDGVDDFLQTPSVDFAGYEQLGSELVTNGSFAADANWDKGTGWSIGSGVATKVAGTASNLGQAVAPVTAGRAYRVTFDLTVTAGSVDFLFTGGSTTFAATNLTTTQTVSVTATALGPNNYFVFVANAAFAGSIDNISVREVLRPADKMTVFAGVRKLSDAARASIAELGAGGTGSFRVEGPGSSGAANYAVAGGGTVVTGTTIGSQASPNTAVVTGAGDISGDLNTIRLNGGALTSSSTADQGTGNYAAGELFIGRRSGSSNPFNGYLYSLIVRGAATSADLITLTERWVNSKAGAY